jgi:hypothetical protein
MSKDFQNYLLTFSLVIFSTQGCVSGCMKLFSSETYLRSKKIGIITRSLIESIIFYYFGWEHKFGHNQSHIVSEELKWVLK